MGIGKGEHGLLGVKHGPCTPFSGCMLLIS